MDATSPSGTPSSVGDKTVRISNIPISVSRAALWQHLRDLENPLGTIVKDSAGNPYISLAPDASDEDSQRFQVATVTFSGLGDVPSVSFVGLGPPGDAFEVIVDTHFRGLIEKSPVFILRKIVSSVLFRELTPLNDPKDPVVDIIALTGLAGHAFGSWRSRVGPVMWLRDLLPNDMESNGYRARVFTYGYDTKLNGSHSYAGVDDHSKQFLEAVRGSRSKDPARPLILIGHSLGGLIIKEAIVKSFGSSLDRTLHSCAGLLLFGVPHKGLAEAGLIGMVRGQPNEDLIRDLCGNSQFLRSLDQSFGQQINSREMGPNIISFYETKSTMTVKEVSPGVWARSRPYVRMVTEESAKHAVENSQYISMDADHSSIVKFTNGSDQNYQIVRRKLLEIANTTSIARTESTDNREERIKLCQWLFCGPFDEKHVEISGKRTLNTGEWLLSHNQFKSWIDDSGPRLLWGCGIPGAGKTFLSSRVIDELENRSLKCTSIGVAYVYFNYKDQNRQMPVTILRSLIKQLITRPHALRLPIPKQVQFLESSNSAAESTPKLKHLQDALLESVELFTKTFFVFDALDECQENVRKDLLPLIHWIAGSGTRIFLTSRPYPQDIMVSLTSRDYNRDIQRLDLEAKKEDVVIYVEKTIQDHISARNMIKGAFRQLVISRLVEACKGMFLLVHFYVEDLCQYTTPNEILMALDGIHSTLGTEDALNGTYRRALTSIRNQHKSRVHIALKALTWLLTARRTLTVDELRMAVRMGSGTRVGDHTLFDETDMPDPAFLLNLCCGLVVIDSKSDTIKFAHYSVQEYLDRTSVIGDVASRHLEIGLDCLDLIWLSWIDYKSSRGTEHRKRTFLPYPSEYLHTHMKACRHIISQTTDVAKILLKFLRQRPLLEHFRLLPERDCGLNAGADHLPLHEATAWGSSIIVSELLQDRTGIILSRVNMAGLRELEWNEGVDSLRRWNGLTPLHVAAREGLVDLVRFWLKEGINVDVMDEFEQTPLFHAIINDPQAIDVARLLLEMGADVRRIIPSIEALGDKGRWIPSRNQMVLLFKFGLSVDQKICGSTLLDKAVSMGDLTKVKFLLRKGARIDAAGDDGRITLHHAVEQGNADTLRLLLLSRWRASHNGPGGGVGAETARSSCRESQASSIDTRDASDRTPLYYAIDCDGKPRDNSEIVKALIESGADVNSVQHGERPLHLAVQKGNAEAMVLLLDGGADIDAWDKSGRTLLHRATQKYDRKLRSKVLVEKGANVDAVDRWGKTPLMYLTRRFRLQDDEAQILIDAGANVNAVDKNRISPLHLAAQSIFNNCDMLARLLDAGADINAQSFEEQTPLHYITKGYGDGLEYKIKLLVKRGARVDATDRWGKTPLMYLAECHTGDDIRILIEAGANVNAIDKNQMSALHHGAQSSLNRVDMLAHLLDVGADINALDSKKRTPLHYAVQISDQSRRRENVRVLVQGHADVNARDIYGDTPLMILVDRKVVCMAWLHNKKREEELRILISAGADVNIVYNTGNMGLLHMAVQNGCGGVGLLAPLLDAGADIHACDSTDKTPLDIAIERRLGIEVIQLLYDQFSAGYTRDALQATATYRRLEASTSAACRSLIKSVLCKGYDRIPGGKKELVHAPD